MNLESIKSSLVKFKKPKNVESFILHFKQLGFLCLLCYWFQAIKAWNAWEKINPQVKAKVEQSFSAIAVQSKERILELSLEKVDSKKYYAHVSYEDEDRPKFGLLNDFYRLWIRHFRKVDIESFLLTFNSDYSLILSAHFPGTFAGKSKKYDLENLHKTYTYKLEWMNGLILESTTRNGMFIISCIEECDSQFIQSGFPITEMTRDQLEAKYQPLYVYFMYMLFIYISLYKILWEVKIFNSDLK